MPDAYRKFHIIPETRTLEYRLKHKLTPIRRLLVHLIMERRSPLALPLATRFKAWRMGFTSLSYTLYRLWENDADQYLRDFPDMNYRMNYPGSTAIGDKLNFARCLGYLGLSVPQVYALIDRGCVLTAVEDKPQIDLKMMLAGLLEAYQQVVLKPICSGAGIGVCFLKLEKGEFFINRVPTSLDDMINFVAKLRYHLLTEFVKQAEYAQKIYAAVTNTLRVLTLWDRNENLPFIAAAAQRIGSNHSFPIDNFHGGAGGLSANLDIDSGVLGSAISLSESGQAVRQDRHPETGGQIAGIQVPGWEKTKLLILKAAKYFAGAPYVGWDLVITENGCCFLEGNSPPGTVIWQVHAPLLANPRVRQFYTDHAMG